MRITRNHIIGGSIVSVFFLIGIANALYVTRAELLEEARATVTRSNELYESSRKTYCEVYLAHLSSCYNGREWNCSVMQDIEKEYMDMYGTDAHTDCTTKPERIEHADGTYENVESQAAYPDDVAPPAQGMDPLFFDDSVTN